MSAKAAEGDVLTFRFLHITSNCIHPSGVSNTKSNTRGRTDAQAYNQTDRAYGTNTTPTLAVLVGLVEDTQAVCRFKGCRQNAELVCI